VEDTAHGVAAAQSAGMYAVAIPNPYVQAAAVAAADLVLGSADDLLLTELLLHATPKGSTVVTE
jgi:beta-phosphoglucomutase-like phosphatase (HAD superfamily)